MVTLRREEELKDGEEPHGHVTSISVLRPYRRLGLAKKLMVQSRTSIIPASPFKRTYPYVQLQRKLWPLSIVLLMFRSTFANQIALH
jgi:peptide alpha-N-acetyltransferase